LSIRHLSVTFPSLIHHFSIIFSIIFAFGVRKLPVLLQVLNPERGGCKPIETSLQTLQFSREFIGLQPAIFCQEAFIY
jgi:hypothetical protein